MNIRKFARIFAVMTLLCGIGVAAKAELRDDVVVTVPFDFIVGHKTLPAGNYKVTNFSTSNTMLRLTDRENGVSAVVLPFEAKSVGVDTPQLSFQRVGERHYLSTIETGQNIYNLTISGSAKREAAAKSHDNVAISGEPGGELMR